VITPLSNASSAAARTQDAAPAPQAPAVPQDAPTPERGAAVVFSFSQAARDKLAEAGENAAADLSAAHEKLSQLHKEFKLAEIDNQIEQIDRYEERRPMNEAHLERLKASYEKMRDTEPKPAVQLTEQQIEEILEKVKDRGIDPAKIGSADNYSFSHEGMTYTFKKDGTAWVNESGVPTSYEQKRMALQGISEMQSFIETNFLQDRSGERADLVSQREALLAE
jgi:hypothetical protein